MMKKIKFPLIMKNDKQVRNLEELREYFDIESLYRYYANGKLITWLEDRYYEFEANAIQEIKGDKEETLRKVCEILCVPYSEDAGKKIEAVTQEYARIQRIQEVTDDESVIENKESVALNQEEFERLLELKKSPIYLVKNSFEIKEEQFYPVEIVGIENPRLMIHSKKEYLDFEQLGMVLHYVHIESDKKLQLKCKMLNPEYVGNNIKDSIIFNDMRLLCSDISMKLKDGFSSKISVMKKYIIYWGGKCEFCIYDYEKNKSILNYFQIANMLKDCPDRINDLIIEKNKIYMLYDGAVFRKERLVCLNVDSLQVELEFELDERFAPFSQERYNIRINKDLLIVYRFSHKGGYGNIGVFDLKMGREIKTEWVSFPYKTVITCNDKYYYLLSDVTNSKSNDPDFELNENFVTMNGGLYNSDLFYNSAKVVRTKKYSIFYNGRLGFGFDVFPLKGGKSVLHVEHLKDLLSANPGIDCDLYESSVFSSVKLFEDIEKCYYENYLYLLFKNEKNRVIVAFNMDTLEVEKHWGWGLSNYMAEKMRMYVNKDEARLYCLDEAQQKLYCLE